MLQYLQNNQSIQELFTDLLQAEDIPNANCARYRNQLFSSMHKTINAV